MKSGKSTDSLMFLGKIYRFFAEIRRAFSTQEARYPYVLLARNSVHSKVFSLCTLYRTRQQIRSLKRLLCSGVASRVIGGGDVHVAFVVSDVGKRLAVQETGGHAAKVAPDVDGGAGLHLRAKRSVCAVQAASRRKIALGRTKNFTQRVVLGLARESITTALSTQALDVSSLVHQSNDLLKVLARDVLALGNVAQRDPAIVNGQVSHCAECVHSLCREHSSHGYSPSLARLLSVPSSVVDAPAAAEPLL